MKNIKKASIVFMAAGLSVAFLASAAAQQSDVWQARRQGMLVRRVARELQLTDTQRASINAILIQERPTIQKLAGEFAEQNKQLRAKNSFDEGFVRSVAQQQAATMVEAVVEKEKIRAEIVATLTPAQQQKLNEVSEKMRTAMQNGIANLGDQL